MALTNNRQRLGERLITADLLSSSQLELALREQKRRGGLIGQILVDLGFVAPEVISDFVAKEAQARLVDLKRLTVDRALLELIPMELARRFRALPLARVNGTLTVAMADPLNVVAIDTLQQVTGLVLDVVTATDRDILNALDQIKNSGDVIQKSIDEIMDQDDMVAKIIAEKERDLVESSPDDAPVIRLVSQIIARAVHSGASDIHFEPEEKILRIRTRRDGVLYQDVLIPRTMRSAVTTRVKIMADMDVTESRLPQDGRATVSIGRRHINLRVSCLPSSYGENIVIRILDTSTQNFLLATLGLAPEVSRQFHAALNMPYGVIIVTGPTGSGKSTTLYAALKEVSTMDVSVFTLEDPIEYRLPGICQTQVREDIGLTFSAGLRTLLRQDPDIILVGETRDTETAQLMVRAALTGHMVFSTLHTNDAAGSIPRLVDMGVEPYLLPASLVALLAQRLVRSLCEKCKEEIAAPEKVFQELHLEPPSGVPLRLWRGRGCPVCNQTGFKGRIGIFELMMIDERYHDPIVHRAGSSEYARLARECGMRTIFEDGVFKALEGRTTVEEVLRVTRLSVK